MEFCNDAYGWQADISLLDLEQFEQVTYPDWFLGSQGKKVTLSRTSPDDFSLLYPKYDTAFHFVVPGAGVDENGDYSVIYNMEQVEEKDYYNKNPYGAYNYGDQAMVRIENLSKADDQKILLIRDSFADCMISCLALCEKNVDALDLRHFNGSVHRYIEETNPDIVMVLYNPGNIGGSVDWESHKSMFDFR